MVESLAFTKWLQGCYGQTIVAGLSQGGAAVILSAHQSNPTVAIVASGWSVINEKAEWSGPSQLIVPGMGMLYQPDNLEHVLLNSSTYWLFTWGRGEKGTYKIEAEERCTAVHIEQIGNVDVAIHSDGHVFPVSEIQTFLNSIFQGTVQ